jgi:hypothetical protein
MLRAVVLFVGTAALGYVALVVLVYLGQDRMLYFPARELSLTPAHRGLPFETVMLPTTDGERLHGWWVPAEDARAAVLFFHGNAGNISGRVDTIALLHRLGLSVLIVDYRGYGKSTGTPSEDGLYRDAAAAYRHLTGARGHDPLEVIVFGRSLGTGPAAWLAAREQVGAVILEAAFTSVPDLAADLYPWLPARLLARTDFDNHARVDDVEAPLLLLHSPGDEIIPFDHGQRLYEAARHPKALVRLDGGHNDAMFATGPRYRETLDRFVTDHIVH